MDRNVTYTINAIDKITSVYRSINKLNDKAQSGTLKLNNKLKATSRSGSRSILKLHKGFIKFARTALIIPKKIGDGFSKLRRKLGDFGTMVAGYMSFRTVVDGLKSIINASSDLSESTSKSRVVFGDYFYDIKRFADGAAKGIGMSKNEALSAASTYASLFKNIGVGGKQVAQMSEASVRLAQDLASFNNVGTEEAQQAMMSILRGETEPAARFGVLLDEVTLKNKALQMGLVKTTKGVLPKAIKTQAIYASLLEQTRDAQGDYARTSDGYANQMKILSAGWTNLSAKAGKLFLPYAIKIQDWGIRAIDWIDRNNKSIKTWGVRIARIGTSLLGLFTIAKGYLVITNYIKITKAAFMAFRLVAMTSPFGWIAAAITGIVLLVKNWDSVKVWMGNFATWMWNNHPFKWLIDLVDRVFPGFKDSLGNLFNIIKGVFKQAAKWMYDKVIKPVFGWLIGLGKKMGLISEGFLGFGSGAANIPAGGDRRKAYSRGTSGNATFDYAGTLGGFSGAGAAGGSGKSSGSSNPVKQRVEGITTGGGKEIKNINIRIDKLVESFVVKTEKLGMSTSQIRKEIERTLISAVNDVNYSI